MNDEELAIFVVLIGGWAWVYGFFIGYYLGAKKERSSQEPKP